MMSRLCDNTGWRSAGFFRNTMKRCSRLSSVVLCVCLLLPSVVSAEFRALLVGINYEQALNSKLRLRGAVNDVEQMHALMTQQLGIPDPAIRMLTETRATRANILHTFAEWLIQGTQPGDTIFFMYSGHGGQQELSQEARRVLQDALQLSLEDPVKLSSEQQKLIEFLIPYDSLIYASEDDAALPILDLEFHALLRALEGRSVHLFFDSCFSEGTTRDFSGVTMPDRHAELPWDLWQYPEKFTRTLAKDLLISGSEVFRTPQTEIAEWFPTYSLFAAVRFFQLAYDLKDPPHGAFTLPVLELLRNNPGTIYTNAEVLAYARQYMQQQLGIPAESQNPVFYGPKDAEDAPFVLLNQGQFTPPAAPAPETQPAPARANITRVRVTHPANTAIALSGSGVSAQITAAIRHAGFLRLDEQDADVIVEVQAQAVKLYTAFGNPIKTITMDAGIVQHVINALESTHVRQQLAALTNPAAPFAVELWIDEPGKTRFTTTDRVTLFYRVQRLPHGEKAYFTLLNVAPGGGSALLYPQQRDLQGGIGEQRYLTAEVESGRVHSIPKDDPLQPGQNAAVDLRLRLEQGQEYFKAIVTSRPIPWNRLRDGDIEIIFHGAKARGMAGIVEDALLTSDASFFWATGDLRVEVK